MLHSCLLILFRAFIPDSAAVLDFSISQMVGRGMGGGVPGAKVVCISYFVLFFKLFMFATGLGLYSRDPDSCRHAIAATITFLIVKQCL